VTLRCYSAIPVWACAIIGLPYRYTLSLSTVNLTVKGLAAKNTVETVEKNGRPLLWYWPFSQRFTTVSFYISFNGARQYSSTSGSFPPYYFTVMCNGARQYSSTSGSFLPYYFTVMFNGARQYSSTSGSFLPYYFTVMCNGARQYSSTSGSFLPYYLTVIICRTGLVYSILSLGSLWRTVFRLYFTMICRRFLLSVTVILTKLH
jgi:hypothetical protein